MSFLRNVFQSSLWSLLSILLMVMLILGVGYVILESQLPDINALKDVELQVPLRIYSSDGKLIQEYGEAGRRIPVTIDQVPKPLIQAVLATEDQRFYQHPGVDPVGLARAAHNLVSTGVRSQGGSTITMQVARNFFLSPEKTYVRKLKEILLAIKIDHELSKDKILELYLNKIFFGHRAYGVAAAAQVYFGKELDQLTLPEMAMVAGLPKAPSKVNPISNPEAAITRRNHVLSRMLENGYIDAKTCEQAQHAPNTASYHVQAVEVDAPYVAEMIRDMLTKSNGKEVYSKGLYVYLTIDSHLQAEANHSVAKGLLAYDQRHGYRGPEAEFGPLKKGADFTPWLMRLQLLPTIGDLLPGVVVARTPTEIEVLLGDGRRIPVEWEGMSWARKETESLGWSPAPRSTADVVSIGDVIRVRKTDNDKWHLAQIPEVEGALVSLDAHTGAIKALVGGFNYQKSKFNRATQATRQPGSSFKPFIYAAALAKGYTLASIINDAPIVLKDTSDDTYWRPQNHNHKFYGPTRLREALVRSQNVVSIRLLDAIGISYALEYARNFGFDTQNLPNTLSLALGTGGVTVLELTNGYATFANGGFLESPYLIDHITDYKGDILYQATPQVACSSCLNGEANPAEHPGVAYAQHTVDYEVAYLMNSVLQSVIREGTGRGALVLEREDIAGKTGTTNDQNDAWFAGFNGDVVTTVWVGFDKPRSLAEYGAQAALPIWVDFMRTALAKLPEHSLPRPASIVTMRIDPYTGTLARSWQSSTMLEDFSSQSVPQDIADDHDVYFDDDRTAYGDEPLY